MNERIRELADQAEEYAVRVATGDWEDGLAYQDLFNKKFAQLIVQDCIGKIEAYHIPAGNSSSGEIACEMTYSALKEIRDDIKENFGVK